MNDPYLSKLHQAERTQRIMTWVIPPIVMFTAVVLAMVNQNQLTTLQRTKQDMVAQQQSSKDSAAFAEYVNSHPSEMQLIHAAVPNEQMLVSFLDDVETVVREYDPAGTVTFVGTTPSRQGADLVIPLVIRVGSELGELPNLITTISQLPYMLQLTAIESSNLEKGAAHVLGYKLYVQEPFSGP